MKKFIILSLALLLAINLPAANAITPNEIPLVPTFSPPETADYYGYSVAISGNVALVGNRMDDDKGANSGSAYIFRLNGSTWTQEQKLYASDALAADIFGSAVAIDGNTAVVVAPGHNLAVGSGMAYVFRYNGSSWVEEAKLPAPDTMDQNGRSSSVSASGNVIAIGAMNDSTMGFWAGAVHVYRYNGSTWVQNTQQPKLYASDAWEGDFFGGAVAVSGDVMVVGAHTDDDRGNSSGSAYVFGWNGSSWVQKQKLLAGNGLATDNFGYAVALSGNLMVVGAHHDDDRGTNFGSVYIFRGSESGSTWTQETELYGSDSRTNDKFGAAVAVSTVSGEMVVIGAYQHDPLWLDGGAAYAFRKSGSTWNENAKLLKTSSGESDYFGYAVGVSGSRAVVGAYSYDGLSYDAGAASVFEVGGSTAPTISASSPPNNFVDALEDRDAMSGTLLGIKDISITFSTPVTSSGGSALTSSNFALSFTRNNAPAVDLQTGQVPSISSITANSTSSYTVHLSSRIPLGAWTKIMAVNVVEAATGAAISTTANSIVLGNLPMDITQDGKVLGDDISRWLAINSNALNPAPLTKILLLDQKRNGVVAGEDITRGIQLINGIGTFRAWSGFDMGAKP